MHNSLSPNDTTLRVLQAEKENAEIRLDDPAKYQSIVDAEWNIIYDKLAKCVASGANIVLSRLAIGDLATQVRVWIVCMHYLCLCVRGSVFVCHQS